MIGDRHFRWTARSGRVGSYAPTRLLATVRTMESRRPPYHHAGLAAAGRDLAADWRRWSAAEKSAALATLTGLAMCLWFFGAASCLSERHLTFTNNSPSPY